MSFSRRQAALQRVLSRRSIQLCILIVFIYLIFFSQERAKGKHSINVNHPKRILPLPSDLPGSPDPFTIFREGVFGNYEPKVLEVAGNQPGENGAAVIVKSSEEKSASNAAINEYGFNTYVSDMIAMNRTIPDIRMSQCKYWHYPEQLPSVSVVIVFHNEGWTPLLRTIHSVLLRSPPEILHEILLIDDYSTKEHLMGKLENYISRFNGKVRLIRSDDRLGLIGARNLGAHSSVADVLVFLDAHCEVNINWLPPLLAPIKFHRKIMTVPVIDGIDSQTWAYRSVYGDNSKHFSGIFEWGLLYKEMPISDQERISRPYDSMPFRSPTHAGGLFAIDRKWFAELGYYDDGLKIWGGEQYELSFKTWQCGGGILFVPCSHVGHVYRHHMPYGFGQFSGKPIISTNMRRVVKTWMDDYEKYYLIREPQAAKVEPGDLTKQMKLKERLKCKNFDWYMQNVAYEVLKSYPLPSENKVWGEARNPLTGKCLDRMGSIPGTLGSSHCHGNGGNQLLRLNSEGQLAQGEWCLTPEGMRIRSDHCTKGTVNGPFSYDEKTKHIKTAANLCITINENHLDVKLTSCDIQNELQEFEWREIYQ